MEVDRVKQMLHDRIDRSSYIPYYAQLKDVIREAIEHGIWKPGSQIPGEPELCRVFDVSRTVVRQALTELEYEGVLTRVKGKGTFVAEPKLIGTYVQNLAGTYRDLVSTGHTPETQVLRQEVRPAVTKVAKYLEIEPSVSVIEIERIRSIKGTPILYGTTYLPYDLCPGIAKTDLTKESLYAELNRQYGYTIARGRRYIEAVLATKLEAELLGIEKGSPLILIDSISYLEDGTPIEYFHIVHRGDRERFVIDVVKSPEIV